MNISGTILKKKSWLYYNKEYTFTTVIGCEHTFLVKEDLGEVGEDVLLNSGEYIINRLSDYYYILEKGKYSLHEYLLKNSNLIEPYKKSSKELEKPIETCKKKSSEEFVNNDDELPF